MRSTFAGAACFAFILFGASIAALADDSATIAPVNVPTGRLIVKLRPNNVSSNSTVRQIQSEQRKPFSSQRITQLSAAANGAVRYIGPLANGAHILDLGNTAGQAAVAAAMANIRGLADVEYVEEDKRAFPTAAPNDPFYSNLWNLLPVTFSNYGANFQTAWNTVTGDASAVIAIVDTGILPHPDIVGAGGQVSPATGNLISSGYDFISDCRERASCPAGTADVSAYAAPSADATDLGDWVSSGDANTSHFSGCPVASSSWHGTHVAGIAAALGNNNVGIIGGAFNAAILPVRVLGKCGGYISDIAEGILWAAGVHPTIANSHPAKVINLSLGGSGSCGATYQNAIDAAVAAGAVVVVAAGNGGNDVANFSPANCNNVIVVSATGQTGDKAFYSNTSASRISLAAPGGDSTVGLPIFSASNGGTTTYDPFNWTYGYKQGTSMAAPHVSAAVALMRNRNPALNPSQVKTILTETSSLTPFPAGSDCAVQGYCGPGILNAANAVANSFSPLTASPATLDFSGLPISSPTVKLLTLINNSNGSVITGTISLSGANVYGVQSNACNSRLLTPGASCTLSVIFSPTAAGLFSATLSVPTTAQGGNTTTTIGLTAAVSYLTTPSSTVVVPTVLAGQSSTVSFSVTNSYTLPVTIGAVTVSDNTWMAVSANQCSNVTLASGDSCSISIITTRSAAGTFSGTVLLNTTDVNDAPMIVTVTGQATAVVVSTQSTSGGQGTGGGGGGGCAVNPSATFDPTLYVLVLLAGCHWINRRTRIDFFRNRSERGQVETRSATVQIVR